MAYPFIWFLLMFCSSYTDNVDTPIIEELTLQWKHIIRYMCVQCGKQSNALCNAGVFICVCVCSSDFRVRPDHYFLQIYGNSRFKNHQIFNFFQIPQKHRLYPFLLGPVDKTENCLSKKQPKLGCSQITSAQEGNKLCTESANKLRVKLTLMTISYGSI